MYMTFLSVVVALLVSAAPPPVVDQEPLPFRRFGVEPEPGAKIGVAVPEALTTVDVEYWISILELEPAAAATLRAAVDDFYNSRTPEIRKVIEPVDRAAADLARRAGFDIMRLPDAPETVADVIRQLRKRSRYQWTPKLPMARVDLRAIETALNKESQIEILNREAWRAARPSYDSELATLHERRIRLDLDMIVEDLENFRDSNYDVDALIEHRTKQNRRQLAVERSIIAANRRWADAFAQMMSPADAERWRDAVRATTYPSLYPNLVDLRRLAQAVGALGSSDSGVEVEAMKQTLVGEIARLAVRESAIESELADVAASESRGLVVQGLREGLEENLARLRRERCESAARSVEMCKATPKVRDVPELQVLISAIQTHCSDIGGDGSATSSQGTANANR